MYKSSQYLHPVGEKQMETTIHNTKQGNLNAGQAAEPECYRETVEKKILQLGPEEKSRLSEHGDLSFFKSTFAFNVNLPHRGKPTITHTCAGEQQHSNSALWQNNSGQSTVFEILLCMHD